MFVWFSITSLCHSVTSHLLPSCYPRNRTMIFCNTIDSARAVEYALNDGMKAKEIYTPDNDSVSGGFKDSFSSHTVHAISYHGEMNSRERETNLNRFRTGENQYLVCTDIAARGIDIPEIDHVILFDFPLNPIDYIHRYCCFYTFYMCVILQTL